MARLWPPVAVGPCGVSFRWSSAETDREREREQSVFAAGGLAVAVCGI